MIKQCSDGVRSYRCLLSSGGNPTRQPRVVVMIGHVKTKVVVEHFFERAMDGG